MSARKKRHRGKRRDQPRTDQANNPVNHGNGVPSDAAVKQQPARLGQVSLVRSTRLTEDLSGGSRKAGALQQFGPSYVQADELGAAKLSSTLSAPAPAFSRAQPARTPILWKVVIVLFITIGLVALARMKESPLNFGWRESDRTAAFASLSLQDRALHSGPSLRLAIQEVRGISGEPLPLGTSLEGVTNDAVVIFRGLIPGMTLSTGSAVGSDKWEVPGTDLANTWIGPPDGFVGVVKLAAELHLPDSGTIAHQESVRVEWIAAGTSDSDQVPIASTPADLDRTPVASTAADSEQEPIATGPSDSDPTPVASTPADSEQGPIATGPSDSDHTPIASTPADSEQEPIATDRSDSDRTRVASTPADSEQEPIATGPSDSDSMPIASARAYSEQEPIASGPAGHAVAPLNVFPAPQLLDHDETATEVTENSVARSEQHAASGQEKPVPRSRPSAREFIDANGFVHIILPRWQSEPIADTRSVKQVIGGTLPPSGPRDLMSQDDVPFAALHGNKLEQEASYPRLEHKSKASNATSSRQIAKNRSRQKQLAVKSQPAKRAIPSPRKPSISPSSNTSRPSVILFPASAGSPARFPPGFHRRGPPLPIVFFRPPMLPIYLPVGRL